MVKLPGRVRLAPGCRVLVEVPAVPAQRLLTSRQVPGAPRTLCIKTSFTTLFFNVAGEFVSVWLRFQVCGICQFETENGAPERGNDGNNKAAMAMRVHAGIFGSLHFSYKCSPEQG